VTSLITSANQLNEVWLSKALKAEVRSVSVEPIGTGQTSSTYRLAIDADGYASSLIAKFASGDEEARRRVATAHRNEVGFYRQIAGHVDVPVPDCWYSAISDDGTCFTLLLEDLAPRQPGRQSNGCSQVQATFAVQNLSRLHASRWNDQALAKVDFLLPLTEARAAFLADLAQTATKQFIARYGHLLDADDVAVLRATAEVLFEWQMNHPEPFSLVHGDYRLDNLMLHPEEKDVVVVDWQTLAVALPARDLSYFIGTSLPIEQRRAEEEQLVATYYEVLRAEGVSGYSFERLTTDYRIGHLHGPMITVIGSLTSSGRRDASADEMFLSMARRSCAAVRDHQSIDVAS
jgi:aminoglycoside phosphotransferase (APT) family kinase protein